ncbi:UNVERIFIED_CONTAM: hypothetical protein GTU68_062667, partial [Idotea baltica]|nr:hypothetical protein [Idotea baltica]
AKEGVVIAHVNANNNKGVIVRLSCETDFVSKNQSFVDLGKNLAMQVAAMRPVAVNKDGVDATTIKREIEIGMEQARQAGKPEAMLEKIAQGKLNKFFRENTLLSQTYVKDGKASVEQYLKGVDPNLTVTDFRHVELG